MKRGEIVTLRMFQVTMVVMSGFLAYGFVFAVVQLVTGGVGSTACMEP
jgi:hypothetical protein